VLQTAERCATTRVPRTWSSACGQVIHDVGGAGRIYSSVSGPDGRRYFSDESNSRIVVEEPGAVCRWSFGRLGSGAGELRHPRGLALLTGETPADTRVFVADSGNHRVQVFDGAGLPVLSFGSAGAGPGQFDMPSDVVVVRPQFDDEDLEGVVDSAAAWIAVADRWNNRVQVFAADGSFVGSVGGRRDGVVRPGADRAGWPFFRVGVEPTFWFPVRLTWNAPLLDVESANGQSVRVNLAVALLPDFDSWLASATPQDLQAARSAFGARDRDVVPGADILAAIDTRVGANLLPFRPADAARMWGRAWPRGTSSRAIDAELSARTEAISQHVLSVSVPVTERDTRVAEGLGTQIALEQRRRTRRASEQTLLEERGVSHEERHRSSHALSRERQAQTHTALGRLASLRERLTVIREDRSPQADVAWTAPPGAGRLEHVAVGHGVLALVAEQEPAVWLFDARCAPLARYSLPSGTRPRGIAPAPGGGWFVTDRQHDCVFQLDESGRVAKVWGGRGHGPDRLNTPLGLAFANGRLHVADRDNDRIQVYDEAGRPAGVYPRLGAPTAVASEGQTLWVAEWGRPGIRQIDGRTGRTLTWLHHDDLVSPVGVAPLSGALLAADHYGAAVHAFDRGGRWQGRLWRAGGRALGRLAAVVVLRGAGIAVDHEHGRLLRFQLPGRTGAWRRK
jgi:DNA-binding beta-propeller fold protein YncE